MNGLNILHFTDIHGSTANLSRIMNFKKKYSNIINDTICTGDMVTDKYDDGYEFWTDCGANGILTSIGNHDIKTSSSTPQVTPKMSYDRYLKPFISNFGVVQPSNAEENGYCYYYKDYSQGYRLIVLDTVFNKNLTTNQYENRWDNTQKEWFKTILNDAKEKDLHVIVAQHFPKQVAIDTENNFTSLDVSNSYNQVCNSEVMDCVQSFINDGGTFVCHIAGHTHRDICGMLKDYPTQLMVILTTAKDGSNGDEDGYRANETSTQDAFNVIGLVKDKHLLQIVRIGYNCDISLRKRNYIVFDYVSHKIISKG